MVVAAAAIAGACVSAGALLKLRQNALDDASSDVTSLAAMLAEQIQQSTRATTSAPAHTVPAPPA